MESKLLASGAIGAEGKYEIKFEGGQVLASVQYDGVELGAQVALVIKTKAGLESLKKLIPGTLDDAIIGIVEVALGV